MEKDEAIKILKDFHDESAIFSVRTALETLHPEFRESEDERIRKALIKGVESCKASGWTNFGNNVDIDVVLAWLEKQGEHKKFRDSIQVGDEVTRNSDGVIVNLSQLNRVAKKDENQGESYTKKDVDDAYVEGMAFAKYELEKQGEQKHADWSEEDKCYMEECISAIATKDGWSFEEKRKTKHWLKSLKDRYTWKPSDEQMEFLQKCIEAYNEVTFPTEVRVLSSLYNDLKKLKGE